MKTTILKRCYPFYYDMENPIKFSSDDYWLMTDEERSIIDEISEHQKRNFDYQIYAESFDNGDQAKIFEYESQHS